MERMYMISILFIDGSSVGYERVLETDVARTVQEALNVEQGPVGISIVRYP